MYVDIYKNINDSIILMILVNRAESWCFSLLREQEQLAPEASDFSV